MSYNPVAVDLRNVWKKYSRESVFHRSLREDIVNMFSLKKNADNIKTNEFWALQDVSFSVMQGETVGLYGPNGAGKSTILKMIANVTYPTRGDVRVNGRVAPLIEIGAGFHPDLTGRENIYMNGAIIGMTLNEIKGKIDNIIRFSELERFIDMPVKKYSSGMYVRLGFSIAIHSSAKIILIDEVISVGDEDFQRKCIERIGRLKDEGRTMVIVSHNKGLLEKITDRILLIHNGECASCKGEALG